MNGSPPPRRLLLIANPISGGGRGGRLAPELQAALRARGVHADVHRTTRAGDAAERAAAAGSEPWDGLVAIGGDGTVNEVLNGMPDPGRPLGVLPVGTANVLALELGLPRAVDRCAAVLADGHQRPLAIGRCDGRRFLLFCGAGLDGAVVGRVAAAPPRTRGKHKWLLPIVQTLWHWPRYRLRATLADGEQLDDLATVLVARVRTYGGLMRLPAEVSCDSGRLHVLGFRGGTRAAFLRQGVRGLLGRMRAGPGLVVRATTAVRIDGDAPRQIDGDPAGHGPAAIDLLPAPARLFVPRGPAAPGAR